LEELNFAINGVPGVSAGYKLEWRLHPMMGIIRMGFFKGDMSLVNLTEAEQSFLYAAKYAITDSPTDAANAWLSAGWTAYCQGKMQEAVTYTESATKYNPELGEAWYQLAKISAAQDKLEAYNYLEKALRIDVAYALKAASDGDFQKQEQLLQQFLVQFAKQLYKELYEEVTGYINANPSYSQIKGLKPEIEEIMGDKILLDYPQATGKWYSLQNKLERHCRKRIEIENAISTIKKEIDFLKEIVQNTDLKQIKAPNRIKELTDKLFGTAQLHKQNKLELTSKCIALINEQFKEDRLYAKELYDKIDRFYSKEISQTYEVISDLNKQIETKTEAYIKAYNADKY
jgi:tetratricopeptide (TPR) repeat protein